MAFTTEFWIYSIFSLLLGICGFYCIMVSRNFIRTLIGLELLTKAVTLLIVVAGAISGKTAMAQSFVITLIVVEVVVIAVAAGIVLGAFRLHDSLDVRQLRNLKG